MNETTSRRSPLQDWFESRGVEWHQIDGCRVAVRLNEAANERAAAQSLALCDLSALPKLGLKGPRAGAWLTERQVDLPGDLYGVRNRGGQLIARIAGDEFVIEGCIAGGSLDGLTGQLEETIEGVYRVERQEATFLLTGSRAIELLAQTCGINFRETPANRILYTRVAGVSCGIVPQTMGDISVFRLWVDYTLALYLWETLVEICESLQGQVIGAGCLFPEWQ